MRFAKILATVALLLACAVVNAHGVRADEKAPLKVGDKVPDFKVKDHVGKEVSPADWKGKTVVLWFFPKADTPGCTKEGCTYRDLAAEFEKKNAIIVGVSFDTVEDNAAFVKKHNFPFQLLCDTDGTLAKMFGAANGALRFAKRNTYLIDGEGKLLQIDEGVNPTTHPKAILDKLGEAKK